ncbi:MAG TPA: zf-HC2 domain-containing protein [Solirubrobacteraceae bacterium]|nr:zf-HC2 domain-containing protein [Solirubrobacteraceae bacterium]
MTPIETTPEVHPQVLLLPWYLAGTLPKDDRETVTDHLGNCAACRSELEELTTIRRTIRATLVAVSPATRHARRWRTLAAAAAVLVFIETGVLLTLDHAPATPVIVASRGLPPEPARLDITANPESSELALRTLLLALSAHVIAGPSADGHYVVELTDADPGRVAAALERARAERAVVHAAVRAP